MSSDITINEGFMYGGWRRPVNAARGASGSIHDDSTAQRLGMRGGTVAGSVHLELFPPLLLEAFGQRWYERGSLSIQFLYATRDREEVRAVISVPPQGEKDVQVEAWLETPDDQKVGEGTASVGDPEVLSALHARRLDAHEAEEPRMLAGLKAGDELPSRDVMITQEEVDRRLEIITDPLDWYRGDSPWGGAIATPANMVRALTLALPSRPQAVGLFGAIELRNVNGPVKVGEPYRASGKIAYVGTSPRTEYYWYDSGLDDKDGKRIAEMRMMLRFMKGSSPLYQES